MQKDYKETQTDYKGTKQLHRDKMTTEIGIATTDAKITKKDENNHEETYMNYTEAQSDFLFFLFFYPPGPGRGERGSS